MNRLFSIGKVIQIRTDPLTVKRLGFVATEEHIRHVVEVLTWLHPHAGEALRCAAGLHDVGKKIYLERDFARNGSKWDSRLGKDNLVADFCGIDTVKGQFTPAEAIKRYQSFLDRGDRVKCFVVRQNPQEQDSTIIAARYQLAPPFGYHAASIAPDDLHGVPEGQRSYVHRLILLHHNFQVDKLVAAAAEHGEDIIADLYRLMSADQEASRWAECVVQKLEGGQDTPQGMFGFSEFAVETIGNPGESSRHDEHVQGQLRLRATNRPDLGERTLTVDYYVTDHELSPGKFLSARKKKGARKT